MSTLLGELTQQMQRAFERCGFDASFAVVTVSDRPDLAQFQCNGALGIAKKLKKNPRDVAQQLVDAAVNDFPDIQFSIAGAGFINLRLTDTFLCSQLRAGAASAVPQPERKLKIILDYGGPNIAKPLHVGHLRSALIGDCIKRLLRFVGHEVYGDIHMGDWGTQMGILICEMKRNKPGLTEVYQEFQQIRDYPTRFPFTLNDLEQLYPEGSRRIKEDPTAKKNALLATAELQRGHKGYLEMWKHIVSLSVESLKKEYTELDVAFDWWYGESRYHDRIEPMIRRLQAAGLAVESEGATVIVLQEPLPPLLLKKSDGAYLYSTTDLAAVEERMLENHADLLLYVVDQRQQLHFDQVFAASVRAGFANASQMRFLGFGTMNGTDGKPFKTRAGGVMKLGDLIEMMMRTARERMDEGDVAQEYSVDEKIQIAKQVGIAALKFADLANTRESNYIFDVEKFSRFEGKTGPYVLYAAVRIQSILRKAGVGEVSGLVSIEKLQPPSQGIERDLMLKLLLFPDVLQRCIEMYAPHVLAEHVYELAQLFNQFYASCHVLTEENADLRAHWLALLQLTQRQLVTGLQLLGISVPERM